eukprot:TRINITY_DN1696_c1_g1_i1.p1 TRINITY_DN1696_c1_g1~~TRINITY_DN1696_c1_g1_i1.p1  ORF type:complete len:1055 (+),score=194.69 TRINITY_DN1696_c1_g1_i1:53-3217(+)
MHASPARSRSFSQTQTEAGNIYKIHVENFLCHSNHEITLGPYVNFITGTNGSGKSALLVALSVCLGANAKSTNRGGSLKDLVKTGSSQCFVTVILHNKYGDTFQHDVYGDYIEITRKITINGTSSYTIKKQGRSCVAKKKDVVAINEHFNIQIENPFSIMMQDTSREFMTESTGSTKYQFFLKATRLQDIKSDLEKIRENLNIVRINIKKNQEILPKLRESFLALRAERKRLKMIEESEANLYKLKIKLCWSHVAAEESNIRQVEEKILASKLSCEEETRRLESIQKDLEKIESTYQTTNTDVQNVTDSVDSIKEEKKKVDRRIHELRKEKSQIQDSIHQIQTSLNMLAKRRERYEVNIKDEYQKKLAYYQEQTERIERTLVDKVKTLEIKKEQLSQIETDKLESERNEWSSKLPDIEQKKRSLEEKFRSINSKIQTLNERKNDRNLVFGRNTNQIKELIQSNSNKFSEHKPIGPIGMYLNIKPGWNKAVEMAIQSNTLDNYIVFSDNDLITFKNLLRSKNIQVTFGIATRIYRPDRYSLSLPDTTNDVLPALHAIKFTDQSVESTIFNYLVDECELEDKILVEGKEIAYELMRNSRKKFFAVDKNGVIYSKRNGTEDTRTPAGNKIYKLSENKESVTEYQRSAEQTKQELSQISQEKQKIDQKISEIDRELGSLRNKKRSLQGIINKLESDIEYAKKSTPEKPHEQDAEEINTNIQKFNSEIEELNAKCEEKNMRMEKLLQEEAPLLELSAQKTERLGDFDTKIEELSNKLKKINEASNVVHGRKKKCTDKIEKCTQDLKLLESSIQKLIDKKNQLHEKAVGICPDRPELADDETPVNVDRQITSAERKIEEQKKLNQRDPQVIYSELASSKKKLDRVELCIKDSMVLEESIRVSWHDRAERWKEFLTRSSQTVNTLFNGYLSQRGFSGSIDFKHEERDLDIKVKVNNSNHTSASTKQLSGGERSFSTVAFLIALWHEMDIPFAAMDEFDVFMDDVNRKESVFILIECGLRSKRQFMFISPKSVEYVSFLLSCVDVNEERSDWSMYLRCISAC